LNNRKNISPSQGALDIKRKATIKEKGGRLRIFFDYGAKINQTYAITMAFYIDLNRFTQENQRTM
jgi:hypothetical protein